MLKRLLLVGVLVHAAGACDDARKPEKPISLRCPDGGLVQGVNPRGEPTCVAPSDATLLALSQIPGVVSIESSSVTVTEDGDGLDLAMPANDPAYTASDAAAITTTDVSTWRGLAASGDHAAAGYVTSESDPVFGASPAAGITDPSPWNTAYGWGDHATAGYLTQEQDSFVGTLTAGQACRTNASGALECVSDPPEPSLVKTILVHPGETPAEGGQALLDAMLYAHNTATADEPILLLLEPGIFAVGANRVYAGAHVTIVGAGACCTEITGSGDPAAWYAVAAAGAGSHWRDLTIEHRSSQGGIGMVVVGQNVSLSNVTVRSAPFVRTVPSTALDLVADASLHAQDCLFEARGGTDVVGIDLDQAELTLVRSTIDAESDSSVASGVTCGNSTLTLESSTVRAFNDTTGVPVALSLLGCDGSARATFTSAVDDSDTVGNAIELINAGPFAMEATELGGDVVFINSTGQLRGCSVARNLDADSPSSVLVTHSRLLGHASGDGAVTLVSTEAAAVVATAARCANSFDPNFVSFSSDCQ